MDWKEQPSILNHFLFINILRVENGRFLKPTVLRFEPRLMQCHSNDSYISTWHYRDKMTHKMKLFLKADKNYNSHLDSLHLRYICSLVYSTYSTQQVAQLKKNTTNLKRSFQSKPKSPRKPCWTCFPVTVSSGGTWPCPRSSWRWGCRRWTLRCSRIAVKSSKQSGTKLLTTQPFIAS